MKTSTISAKRSLRFTVTILLIAMVILATAAVTVVSKQQSGPDGDTEKKKIVTIRNLKLVKVAGQEVKVDTQTGQIAELTPEEARKLAVGLKKMINQSTEGLQQVHHSNGSVSVDLQGRFQNVTVARVNKDGRVSQSCVDNPRAAAKFFGIDPQLIEEAPRPTQATNRKRSKTVERQK
ncbi:MAG TPA: hypothetical protein VJU84_18390 [Pyrinomonadaceae bacterium]|nr:hypothetical protein [Pyrinomonadaceae bacterium]